MLHFVKKTGLHALNMILPPRCVGTGQPVDQNGTLSSDYWKNLEFIEAPFCKTCGQPFHFAASEDTLCAGCLDTKPLYTHARSAVIYNDASRKLILEFKHGDKLHLVRTLVPWMHRAGRDLITATDTIIPVPLHPFRLWKRRYNQSAILAGHLARITKKDYIPDALIRLRHTPPQKGLSRDARSNNVKGAFIVHPKHNLKGKNILLIDDVMTSGATLNECTRILKRHGTQNVYVLTIARVTRDT